jgi:hypothetical protein
VILNKEEFFEFINKENLFIYANSTYKDYNLGNQVEINKQISENCDVHYFKENTVAYFKMFNSFYHFYIDEVALIFNLFKKDPTCLFLIEVDKDQYESGHFGQPYLRDFFNILKDFGIKYKIIYNKNNKKIAIFSKATYIKTVEHGRYKVLVDGLVEKLSLYGNKDGSVPNKKVYLSRSMVPQRDNFLEMNTPKHGSSSLQFKTDKRINNEDLIEIFFQEHGFEIVCPENFQSLFDQINFMSRVKLLISASGSGLTNYILMQKNQKVIELMTTIATSGYDQVMSFFLELSFAMNHQHIIIPHSRDPEEIIKSLKNNKYLMELINE